MWLLGPLMLLLTVVLSGCQTPGQPTVIRGTGMDQTQAYHLRQGSARFTVRYDWSEFSTGPDDPFAVALFREGKDSAKLVAGNARRNKPIDETLVVNIPETGDYRLSILAKGPWLITIQQ